jgi:saccharopine dehydrogenase-like NADP-dependent oxidoreductase
VRVTVEGRRGGRAARRVVSLVDRMDGRTGLSAMMRCTAFPAACIVKMLADGVVTERGVHCQEKVVPAAAFVSAMRAAGLAIKLRTSVR